MENEVYLFKINESLSDSRPNEGEIVRAAFVGTADGCVFILPAKGSDRISTVVANIDGRPTVTMTMLVGAANERA